MKFSVVIFFMVLISNSAFAIQADFPKFPDPKLTPGILCTTPSELRYPEQIPYCNRSVDSNKKKKIIDVYDSNGYSIQSMNRSEFKIDHYIPLCAGGSNDSKNLWPQHKSVYIITDPVEELVCQKMAEGKLLQVDAVRFIVTAKNNFEKVNNIMRALSDL